MDDQLPIIPHESLGADCCGCLMVRVREDYADIICNECDAVIRTTGVAEVENTLRELARTDAICNARCPHCGIVNTFPGWKMIEAFVCSACGRGGAHDTKLQ
jgi:hypothetical protein